MFDIIVKLNFENESNEWWCLTKYPETLRNEKYELSDPTRNGMNKQNEKRIENIIFFIFSFFFSFFHSANLVRTKVHFFQFWKFGQTWKFICFASGKSGKHCKFNIVPSVFVFSFNSDILVNCKMLKFQFSKYQDSKQPLFKTMPKKREEKTQKKWKQNKLSKWKKMKINCFYYFLEPGRRRNLHFQCRIR